MLPTYPLPFPLATSSGNSLYPSLSENMYTQMWIHLKINFCPSFEPSVHAKVGLFTPKLWAFSKYKQIIKSVHYTCVDNHWKLLRAQAANVSTLTRLACTAAGFCHYHGIMQKSRDHISYASNAFVSGQQRTEPIGVQYVATGSYERCLGVRSKQQWRTWWTDGSFNHLPCQGLLRWFCVINHLVLQVINRVEWTEFHC